MKLGINALFNARGGALTRLEQLLKWWSVDGLSTGHEVSIFCSAHTIGALRRNGNDSFRYIPLSAPLPSLGARMVLEQFTLPRMARQLDIDVLFSPANTLPVRGNFRQVLFLQNILPFSSQLRLRGYGGYFFTRTKALGILASYCARRADHVLVNSEFFRAQLIARGILDDRTCSTVHSASDGVIADPGLADAPLARFGVTEPYLICVSALYPYKNFVELVCGYRDAERESRGSLPPLLVVGEAHFGRYRSEVERTIRDAPELREKIIMTGSLPREEVLALMARSLAFVFSSMCEACPTVLVEAQALGLPVVSSSAGVMPEICGDAALYFNAASPTDARNALLRISRDGSLRDELAARSRVRASEHQSERTMAASVWNALRAVGDG